MVTLAHLIVATAVGVWPLQPQPAVVHPFDPPEVAWGAGHRGVDLLGIVGQDVRAALPGEVSFAGSLAGRGVVVVDHGETRTTYEPVLAEVQVGDQVAAGAVLGSLSWFGSHCGLDACLHWGLIEGHVHYLDPLSLVGGCGPLPVRLLPLEGPLPESQGCAPPATGLRTVADSLLRLVGVLAGRPVAAGQW